MNKKLVLSVLSTALVASMASAAMAKPSAGIYIGGDVDKYYGADAFLDNFDAALDEILSNLNDSIFVDGDANAARLSDALDPSKNLNDLLKPATKADFEANPYAIVGGEGSYDPTTDPDLGDATPGELEVVSVSAINLAQLKISFGVAVDEDTIADAVKVDGYSVSSYWDLSEDGKTITILGEFGQLQNLTVTIDGLKSKDGSKTLSGYSQNVQVKDVTAPEVVSAVATSPKTVEIVFSEPVDIYIPSGAKVWEEFFIDGINPYGTLDANDLYYKNKVTLKLATPLTVGEHSLKVTGIEDFARFPAAEKTMTITVAEDTVAPSIASAKLLTNTSAEIVFDEQVDDDSVQTIVQTSNFTIEGQRIQTAIPKADGKTYTITWNDELEKGALVEVVISYKGIKDHYGNTVTEAKTFKFQAADDTIPPTVTGVIVNADNTLEVTFSEDVTGFDGSYSTALELYDKDNTKLTNRIDVAPKYIAGQYSQKVYVVYIYDADLLSGAHTLKLLKDKVTDTSVRKNKNAEQSFSITLKDVVPPQMTKAEFVNEDWSGDFNRDGDATDSKITIFFNEAMDASTLTNKANYILSGRPVTEVAGATLTAAADNKSVTLTINKGRNDDPENFGTSTDLRVLAVKDVAGNTLDPFYFNKSLGSGSGNLGIIEEFDFDPEFDDVVASVEAISKNELKIKAESGYTFAAIDPNRIKFNEDAYSSSLIPDLQVMRVAIAADGKSAVLTLNKDIPADLQVDGNDSGQGTGNLTVYAEYNAIVLGNGAKTDSLYSGDAIYVQDKIAPSLVVPASGKLATSDDTVALDFDEELNVTGSVADALTLRDSAGRLLRPTLDYTATFDNNVDPDTITVKLVKPGFADTVSVALVDNRVIYDAVGNHAKDFAALQSDDTVTSVSTGVAGTATVAQGSNGTAQVETATIATGATASANVVVAVTVNGSSTSTNVAVTNGDSAAVVAAKIAQALTVTGYTVTSSGSKVVLTATTPAANDTTLNVSIDGTTNATGVTNAPTSVDTTAGAAATSEVVTLEITSGAAATGDVTVTVDGTPTYVPVVAEDTKAQVATKIKNALTVSGYTVDASGSVVTITSNTPGDVTDLTVTLN